MAKSSDFEEFYKCMESPWHFTNHIKTEYKIKQDGIKKTIVKDYPHYPYLKDMLEGFSNVGNLHDEKSRQMLWSWTAMVDTLHSLTFIENYSERVISRVEELVDDGGKNSTTDSLFGRLRFMWDFLPKYLKAPLEFTHLKVVNKSTGAFVRGSSTTSHTGRGGTYNKIKGDEWAFVNNSESVFSAIKSACPDNIKLGSTPHGKGNNFSRIRFDKNTGFKKRSWHWQLHPERNQQWYENEKIGMTKEQIARELDLSYEGSLEGVVYYEFNSNLQVVDDLEYNYNLPTFTAWDFGISDETAILVIQENPNGEIYIIDEYENREEMPRHYAYWLKDTGYKRMEDIGDPAGKQRGVTKQSWVSELKKYDIQIKCPYPETYENRIMITRKIIPKLFVSKKCTLFLERISNYKFPTNADGSVKAGSKPVHDWASHMMTALEFYAVRRFGLRGKIKGM